MGKFLSNKNSLTCIQEEGVLLSGLKRWDRAVQTDQQVEPWFGEENQREGSRLHVDGECPSLPGGHQKVRSSRHGDLPDGGLI